MEGQTMPERRRFERRIAIKPCKVRARGAARYSAGRTSDYSAGGALVCLGIEHRVEAGDQIEFGIAWGEEAVLSDHSMRLATVRRVTPVGRTHQAIGVEFAEADPAIVTRAAQAA